jgi:hypothetical protein
MCPKIYYEYSTPYAARSNEFLAVDGCSGVFNDLCRDLNFVVFGKRSLFYGVVRLKICESANVDQIVLISQVVDGVFFRE